MKSILIFLFGILSFGANTYLLAQKPIMGWSSWNHFRIDINENIIKAQADAMASNGMKEAGYQYINIDDGYFGGRDSKGNLLAHPERFPNGMKSLANYIHSKGFKAGIYSDAGKNTCGSIGLGNTGSAIIEPAPCGVILL